MNFRMHFSISAENVVGQYDFNLGCGETEAGDQLGGSSGKK